MAKIGIHVHSEGTPQPIYHWQILRDDDSEVSHSAYHTDREKCLVEAEETLRHYRAEGWVE